MKLVLSGRAGSRACDWRSYALLRDNVQHFIEFGEPREHFPALHGIENAVDYGRQNVDAARLRGEVLRAWYALWKVSIGEAAVSLRTRAILTASADEPGVRGTVSARHAGWQLPIAADGGSPVPQAAEGFVRAVLELTEGAVDGDALEIRRHGPPPRFTSPVFPRNGAPSRVLDLTRKLRPFLATGLAVLTLACGSVAASPARWAPSPPAEGEPMTELDDPNRNPELAPVVAPPPAYGNKVVRVSCDIEPTPS